jgi:hypothetical protein
MMWLWPRAQISDKTEILSYVEMAAPTLNNLATGKTKNSNYRDSYVIKIRASCSSSVLCYLFLAINRVSEMDLY